jgi:ketosteroid isomerase-like protein
MLSRVSEHPNAAVARAAWDALSRGDSESLRGLLAPDLVWHATARRTPWAGEHRGPDAIVDFLARVGEVTDEFHATLRDVLASEERVLVVFHVGIAIGARRTELDYLLLGRIEKGRFAEIWTLPMEPDAIEAFWSTPLR